MPKVYGDPLTNSSRPVAAGLWEHPKDLKTSKHRALVGALETELNFQKHLIAWTSGSKPGSSMFNFGFGLGRRLFLVCGTGFALDFP